MGNAVSNNDSGLRQAVLDSMNEDERRRVELMILQDESQMSTSKSHSSRRTRTRTRMADTSDMSSSGSQRRTMVDESSRSNAATPTIRRSTKNLAAHELKFLEKFDKGLICADYSDDKYECFRSRLAPVRNIKDYSIKPKSVQSSAKAA